MTERQTAIGQETERLRLKKTHNRASEKEKERDRQAGRQTGRQTNTDGHRQKKAHN